MFRQRRTGSVQWSIDQFRSEIYTGSGELGQLQQRTLIDSRGDLFTHRIDPARDPLVVLGAVDPRGDVSARFHFRNQRHEPAAWVRQMVQNADGERVIKLSRQRKVVYVCLNDVCVGQRTRGGECRLHRGAEIDSDHVACSPACGELRVTPLPAASFEHNLVAKKLRRDGRDPAEKLFRISLVFLCEVLPLPAEARSRSTLITLNLIEICETWYAGSNRERGDTGGAAQLTLHDLFMLGTAHRKIQRPFTRGTHEIRE